VKHAKLILDVDTGTHDAIFLTLATLHPALGLIAAAVRSAGT
jgi:inosine-uridine nucleoside N-ribohydrolase